jgi:hypothetical protein
MGLLRSFPSAPPSHPEYKHVWRKATDCGEELRQIYSH